jgi:hypothetical protein
VRWPARALDPTGEDLSGPVGRIVDQLNLLRSPAPERGSTTAGIIESTAFGITKQTRLLIVAGGGLTAVAAGIGTWWAETTQQNTALAVTLAGGAAVVVAAAVLALAQVMSNDVRGRALATSEQLRSRAEVATAFLNAAADHVSSSSADAAASVAGSPEHGLLIDLQIALGLNQPVVVTTVHGRDGAVRCIERTAADGLRLTLDTGDQISLSEIASFTTVPLGPPPPPPPAPPAPVTAAAAGAAGATG